METARTDEFEFFMNRYRQVVFGFVTNDLYDFTRPPENRSEIKRVTVDGKLIVAGGPYRTERQVYPEYKANREAKRDSSIVNFDVFFPVVEKFFTVLKESFRNIPFVQIPRCEADDIIAVITKNRPNWDIINVSSDKDFHQLYVYPNYRQYDGVKHCFVECLDPEKELTLKIITGDRGDNVPGIKYGIGEKRALKILDEDLDLWLAENSLKETFERNMKLISFRCIPKDIENTILSVINNLTYDTVDTKRYFKFIQMSGLAGLMDTFTDYMNTVKQVH